MLKKTISIVIVFIIALSALPVFSTADQGSSMDFSAELISDGKLIDAYTNLSSDVSVQSTQDTLYDCIYNGLISMAEQIDISGFGLLITNSQHVSLLQSTYAQVVNENPVLFYIQSRYSVTYKWNVMTAIVPAYMENAEEHIKIFNEKSAEILSRCIKKGMTDADKLLALHDYIAKESEYNYGELTNSDYTAYGIIVNKTGVCQSYSLAYNYLLSLIGIQTKFCTSDPMVHGWSLVELNGKWYHIDITWDDPKYSDENLNNMGLVQHDYFLVSDETISSGAGAHYGWTADVECTDKTYETGLPFISDSSKIVSFGNVSFTGYYPWIAFSYNEDDGMFYSGLYNSSRKVYFKTDFSGSAFEYITADEYNKATSLPAGISAYAPLSISGGRAEFAGKNHMSNLNVTFENNSSSTASGIALAAVYDYEGRLISCGLEKIEIPAYGTAAVYIDPEITQGAEYGKIYLWDEENQTEMMKTPVKF